jgi:hypothetical protein
MLVLSSAFGWKWNWAHFWCPADSNCWHFVPFLIWWVPTPTQPVEKVFCRALQSCKVLYITLSNASSYLLKLSILGFSTGWTILGTQPVLTLWLVTATLTLPPFGQVPYRSSFEPPCFSFHLFIWLLPPCKKKRAISKVSLKCSLFVSWNSSIHWV